jgi:DNA-binding GntR family transcriptional regulator
MPSVPRTAIKASEQIRLDVADQISRGHLLPGDPVDEHGLTQRYKVSKTPVREALLQLKAQGLLSAQPRGGMVVAKIDLRQLLSLWELLGEIEAVATKLACERMSAQEIDALAHLHEASCKHAQADDWAGWQQSNEAFHEAIYEGARNPYLRQEVLRIRARTGVYRMHAFGAIGRPQSSFEQHGELVALIKQRNATAAAQAMVRHILPAGDANTLTHFIMNIPKELLAP